MEKRDYLVEQIEQLGRALGQMIAKLLNLKYEKQLSSLAIEKASDSLKLNFDVNIDTIINSKEADLDIYLLNKKFNHENLEFIIDYLRICAENIIVEDKNQALRILKRTLYLYKILDSKSNTCSFYRIGKEQEINNMINS